MRRQAGIGALLLIGVGIVLGATVFRSDIAQATGLAQSVTVTNTPAQAVPVREQNLDGGNIKVHEQGTASVRDIDNPARQPVMLHDTNRIFPDDTQNFNDLLYTVPANKLLVVEYLHYDMNLPTGDQGACSLFLEQQNFLLTLPMVHTASYTQFGQNTDRWNADLPVRLYVTAGTDVHVDCADAKPPETRSADINISGYLVNVA